MVKRLVSYMIRIFVRNLFIYRPITVSFYLKSITWSSKQQNKEVNERWNVKKNDKQKLELINKNEESWQLRKYGWRTRSCRLSADACWCTQREPRRRTDVSAGRSQAEPASSIGRWQSSPWQRLSSRYAECAASATELDARPPGSDPKTSAPACRRWCTLSRVS